jgi:hypothetical protein
VLLLLLLLLLLGLLLVMVKSPAGLVLGRPHMQWKCAV